MHIPSKPSLTDRNTPTLSARNCHVPYGEFLLDLQSGEEVKVCWTRGLSELAADHHADSSVKDWNPQALKAPSVRSVMPRLKPRNQSSDNKTNKTRNDVAIVFPNICCGV